MGRGLRKICGRAAPSEGQKQGLSWAYVFRKNFGNQARQARFLLDLARTGGLEGLSQVIAEAASVNQKAPPSIYALRQYKAAVTIPPWKQGSRVAGTPGGYRDRRATPPRPEDQPVRLSRRGRNLARGTTSRRCPRRGSLCAGGRSAPQSPLRRQRPLHERRVPRDERPYPNRHQLPRRTNLGRPAHHLAARSRAWGQAVGPRPGCRGD